MFWEAGVVIQVPIGVMVAYPSAIMVHFNIKFGGESGRARRHPTQKLTFLQDFQLVVTKDGERPTPQNSVPLQSPVEGGGSRCSMVWFTQASVFRAAHLAGPTKGATEEMEKEAQRMAPRQEPYFPVDYDAAAALAAGYFPYAS